ncbi:putative GNAT family acetyltransferase [Xylaria castorea]|nr:putative GNAT family acetyltransferase [Xylaria castorea]
MSTGVLTRTVDTPDDFNQHESEPKEGASRLLRRWQSATKNKEGQANTSQASFVDDHGDQPTDSPADLITPLPPREALREPNVSLAREKASSNSPAMFTLDTCAVDPAFQRRGVAGKLVERGLQKAKRRGDWKGAGEYLVYEVDEEFRHRDKPAILLMGTAAS